MARKNRNTLIIILVVVAFIYFARQSGFLGATRIPHELDFSLSGYDGHAEWQTAVFGDKEGWGTTVFTWRSDFAKLYYRGSGDAYNSNFKLTSNFVIDTNEFKDFCVNASTSRSGRDSFANSVIYMCRPDDVCFTLFYINPEGELGGQWNKNRCFEFLRDGNSLAVTEYFLTSVVADSYYQDVTGYDDVKIMAVTEGQVHSYQEADSTLVLYDLEAPSQIPGDTNNDGVVDRIELGQAIADWIGGTMTRTDLGQAIQSWALQ